MRGGHAAFGSRVIRYNWFVKVLVAHHVAAARARGEAIVALESTVVTHGLPAPHNLALARDLEATVRDAGAMPATIGIIDGRLIAGLDDAQLAFLAQEPAAKASLWNLAALLATGANAGTTVATTLYAAHAVGIEVFATGGIGGVHDAPFDESADLAALAHTPVVTVCAGPKSILDARATLERLESAGVPVLGYRSDHLAGFHVPTTDIPVAHRVDDPTTIASIKRQQDALALPQGIVISNPVSNGIPRDTYERWLRNAHAEAIAANVSGPGTTPFLLDALAKASEGVTVDVNLRLLHENADLAAQVARALASFPNEPGDTA